MASVALQPCDVGIVEARWLNPFMWPFNLFLLQRTSTTYSHAFLVMDTWGAILDPTFPRLVEAHISIYQKRKIHILRPQAPVPTQEILSWGRMECKVKRSKYDFLSWLGFLIGVKKLNDTDAWYCTEFVDAGFAQAGYQLWCERPAFIYPADLRQNPRFTYVGIY